MTLRQLESTLAGLVGQVVTSDPKINKLTDIGISTTKEGLLTIDMANLQKALETDAVAVEALFNPRAEEHTSVLQSLMRIPYALLCLKKKKRTPQYVDQSRTQQSKQTDNFQTDRRTCR